MKEKVYRTKIIDENLYWHSAEEFLSFMTQITEKYKDKENLNISIDCSERWEYGELYTEACIYIGYYEDETDEEYENRLKFEESRHEEEKIKSELVKMNIPVTNDTIKLYKEGRLK